jgi:hypothetical protein
MDPLITDFLLIAVSVGGAIWVLIPAVMFGLGLTRFRIEVTEEPAGAEPAEDDPDYRRRFQQFAELGFRPVGTTVEICWFMNPIKWYRRSIRPLRWLSSSDGRYLVSFHRLIPTEPIRFGIVTLLTNEGMVRTTCPGVGKNHLEGNRLRIEVPNVEAAELFDRHKEHVQAFCGESGLAVRGAKLPEAAFMEELNTRLLLPKLGAGQYRLIVSFFALPALIAAGIAARFGFLLTDWHTWAGAICFGTGVFAFFRLVTYPQLFQQAVTRTNPRRQALN